MKNKKKINKNFCVPFIGILLLIIFIFVISNSNIIYSKLYASINSSINNIDVECQKNNISVGETISCTLKGNSVEQIQLFEGNLVSNSNIEISNVQKDSIWVVGSNSTKMQYISDGTIGTFNIVTFNVKGIKDGEGIVDVQRLRSNSPLAFTTKDLRIHNLVGPSHKIIVGNGSSSSSTDNENNNSQKGESSNDITNNDVVNRSNLWMPQTGQNVIRYFEIIIGIGVIIFTLMIIKNKIKK